MKIGIIGAGPAGLAVSVCIGKALAKAGETSCQIDLIEKNKEAGKKLLATGNGKCNITNKNAKGYEECREFFEDLGILFSEEDEGRMYPCSKQARSVRDVFVEALGYYGINLKTGAEVKAIKKEEGEFTVFARVDDGPEKELKYDVLVVTTGGKAGIQYGSSGDGFKFARDFGINVLPVLPALVPMTYDDKNKADLKKLKGVRTRAVLTLMVDGERAAEERGEIQFTDYGISGICTFDLSRYLKDVSRKDGKLTTCEVVIDLVPDYEEEAIANLLKEAQISGLKGIVNEKIESLILGHGLNPKENAEEIAHLLKNFTVKIDGTKGWKESQVTSGGVDLSEVNMECMESKKVEGLYFAGEVLDYDGPCGGYNLTWAWNSGRICASSITDRILCDD